jgi:hypothetical protein
LVLTQGDILSASYDVIMMKEEPNHSYYPI